MIDNISGIHVYRDYKLGQVVTIQEAGFLWGKSVTALKNAIMKDHVEGRKSLSGGTWLITVASMQAYYGVPKNHILWDLLDNQDGKIWK